MSGPIGTNYFVVVFCSWEKSTFWDTEYVIYLECPLSESPLHVQYNFITNALIFPQDMLDLASAYSKVWSQGQNNNIGYYCELDSTHVQALEEESTMTPEQLALKNVGKQVPI